MKVNNVNVEAMGRFIEQVKADAGLAKKQKRVEGSWNFEEGRPQFGATMAYAQGQSSVESDFAPFMGGEGLAPDPIQYCLYGMAACYAGTFVGLAAAQGVALRSLSVIAENRIDLTRTLGLGDNPAVEGVSLNLVVESDADDATLNELDRLARDRCPGIYCLTSPIPLDTALERAG